MGSLACLLTMSSEAKLLYAAFIKNLSSNEPLAVKMRDTFRSDNGQAEIMKSLELLNLPSAKEISEHIATFIKSHLDNNSALEKLAENIKKDALTVAGNCGTSPLVSVAAKTGETTTCNGSQKTQDSGLVGERFLCRLPSLPDSPLTGFQDPRLKNPTELLKRGWKKLYSGDKGLIVSLFPGNDISGQEYALYNDGTQTIRTSLGIDYRTSSFSTYNNISEIIKKSSTGEISRYFEDPTLDWVHHIRYSANDKDADEKVNRALAMYNPDHPNVVIGSGVIGSGCAIGGGGGGDNYGNVSNGGGSLPDYWDGGPIGGDYWEVTDW